MAATALSRLSNNHTRVCSLKLLKYDDSKKNLHLEVDASQKAISMALSQSVQEEHQSEAHGVHRVEAKIDNC